MACTHPFRALRFDGLWSDWTPVLASVTCDPERGGCGTSLAMPVRVDACEKCREDRADVGKVAHGGPRGHASGVVMSQRYASRRAESIKPSRDV